MKPAIIVIGLDGKSCLYAIHIRGVVISFSNQKIGGCGDFILSTDFFIGYFLQNLVTDSDLRSCIRHRLQMDHKHTVVRLVKSKDHVDKKGCEMALQTTYERMELLTMLSWFSTFGGAYSNLGDEFENCATIAGKISVQQMKLATKLDDPYVMCRCKLYYAISLIQKGIIAPAKRIIRTQYKFAKQEEEADNKLLKMCLGIWSKLLYVQDLKRKNKLFIK